MTTPSPPVHYDYARRERIGMPEAILCDGKDCGILSHLVEDLSARPDHPVLLTRLTVQQHDRMSPAARSKLDYDPLSRTALLNGHLPVRAGRVAVITAGTSDLATAMEAQRTLSFMGITSTLIADVGVAGLWRLMERIDEIKTYDALIVVAGMDAALLSVIGGLVGQPVIGVPTSVGYGVATGGHTALNSMLASCAQGLLIANIDNGFGAACAAARMLRSPVETS